MTTTMRLYEIAEARAILDTWLAESEGELTPDLEQMLDELDGQAEEKIERVGLFIRERAAEAKAVREERDRLDALMRRDERAVESLKRYVKTQMERLGKTKVNGLLATVAIQKNSMASVTTVLEPSEIWAFEDGRPFVKREEKVVYSLDRDAILAAWKSSQPLPVSISVEHGSHVRVR
jgi:hypothetical protein